MRTILKHIAVLIIMMAVLTSVLTTAYVIKIKMNPSKVPSFATFKPLVVLTGSMGPHIKPGDMIFVKNTNIDKINIEDIITYSVDENTYITHRVKEKLLKDGKIILKTQGDANNEEDNIDIYENMLIGSVKFTIPKAGFIIQFVQSVKGFILLVTVPVFILLLEQIYIKTSNVKRNKNRRYGRRNNLSR